MKVLAINCGSSSLKFAGFDIKSDHAVELFKGRIQLGRDGKFTFQRPDKKKTAEPVEVSDHKEATRIVFDHLQSIFDPEAIGHRIVHGGTAFEKPVVIDKPVLKALDTIPFAPLHNGQALNVIRATQSFATNTPMVATFDTAFHCTLPEHARRYAIPERITTRHDLWRFGFHGLAYRSMLQRFSDFAFGEVKKSKLIALQLGSGCSAAAILNGKCVETSMGLTPLEGLMMATRCGDLDPSLPDALTHLEGIDASAVSDCLNTQSGLLGVSGVSSKVDGLLELETQGHRQAHLALEMYCHRIRKYIGAYLAVLGGADAILFGGGVGENAPAIRARICTHMDWSGLSLDEKRNSKAIGQDGCISPEASKVKAYVLAVNEEAIIARDTFERLQAEQKG
jgi:acetate kinase